MNLLGPRRVAEGEPGATELRPCAYTPAPGGNPGKCKRWTAQRLEPRAGVARSDMARKEPGRAKVGRTPQ